MDRRNFIKLVGIGATATVFSSTMTACGQSPKTELYGWGGPDPALTDIRLKVLSYAMLAPNPHNKQPWIVKLTGPSSFELYVDPDRLLPETDPVHRQIHIGQGTFLETASIAASALAYRAKIDYFPADQYDNTSLANKPVAAVTLIPQADIKPDPLFSNLLNRHSNKSTYDKQALSSREQAELSQFHQQNSLVDLSFHSSKQDQQKLSQFLTQAMTIETGHPERDLETIKMFRFNDDEVAKYRDGFGLDQSNMSGIMKWAAETFFLSREKAEKDPSGFGEQAITMTKDAAESTATFARLTSTGNERIDQVKVGRDYCRINIKTTAMGLAQHPMSQILQEYPDMLALQQSFKKTFEIPEADTVQMLFRLGRAKPNQHSPRRQLASIIST